MTARRGAWLACAGAAALAACASLPDLKRAEQALARGDGQAAEADLKPLAEEGYEDAKLKLARVYAQRGDESAREEAVRWYQQVMRDDPEVAVPLAKLLMEQPDEGSLEQAERMLRQADKNGDERALVPLIALLTDFPEQDNEKSLPKLIDRAARHEDPEYQALVVRWHRRNATDPKSARQLVKMCEEHRGVVPECHVDLARHYRAAGDVKGLKRVADEAEADSAVPPHIMERLAWSYVNDDVPGDSYPDQAYRLLRRVAADSPTAQVRLARLLVEYPFLDPNGKPEELLLAAVKSDNPEAALALGRLYMNGTTVPQQPARAEQYLKRAAAANVPAAHFYLGRMYRRGDLGATDMVKAAHHLLTAARGGYAQADVALAQLFIDNKGVKANPANAFVFASLAANRQLPGSAALLQQVRAVLKPPQLQEGQRLLRQEVAVRQAAMQSLAASSGAPVQARAETQP